MPPRLKNSSDAENIEHHTINPSQNARNLPGTEMATLLSTRASHHAICSAQDLLRLAEAAGCSTLQIDTALLAALIKSFRQIEGEVINLRNGLDTVRESNGILFTPFKKLPLELRLNIWKLALFTPRVISLKDTTVWLHHPERCPISTLTPRCFIRHACQEARTEACKIQTPLFAQLESAKRPLIFINGLSDTFFIHNYSDMRSLAFELDRATKINSIAVPLESWVSTLTSDGMWHVYNFINEASRLRSQELVVVIGKPGSLVSPDGMLVSPRHPPQEVLPEGLTQLQTSKLLSLHGEKLSWALLEERQTREICEYEAGTIALRKELSDRGLDPDDEMNWDKKCLELPELPWTVKKIRYVEAVIPGTLSRGWRYQSGR